MASKDKPKGFVRPGSTPQARKEMDKMISGADRKPPTGPTRRLTVDVDMDLYRKFYAQCVSRGEKMTDVIRGYIQSRVDNA